MKISMVVLPTPPATRGYFPSSRGKCRARRTLRQFRCGYLIQEPGQQAELCEQLEQAFQVLNYRERAILRFRFGLRGLPVLTLKECGKLFKITRERVRTIEYAALAQLRRADRPRHRLRGFLSLQGQEELAEIDRAGRYVHWVRRDR